MRRAARIYVNLVIMAGALVVPLCVFKYVQEIAAGDTARQLVALACLALVCCVCRSAPIHLTPEYALDVSILPVMAAVLMRGPYTACLVYLISSFFTVEIDHDTRKAYHIYNTPIQKTAFNNANLLLSILLPGLLIEQMGHVRGDMSMPWVLLPMLVFTALTFLMNGGVLFCLFFFNKEMRPRDALGVLQRLIPNVLAAMPLGLLTCYAFNRPDGYWIALLMVLPLMMARYAWKLYLDARKQYFRLIHAFVLSVEARDKYTEGHSRRVNQYAVQIAEHMHLKPSNVEIIRIAALLHDVGKLGIADSILLKPSALTDDEYTKIKSHPQIGANIVGQVKLEHAIADIILHHHERYDGSGYPDRLSGGSISLGAQIMAVADSYDAMTSERPYRKGLSDEEAQRRLIEGKGTQFNPNVVDVFLAVLAAQEQPAPEAMIS